MGTKKAMAIIPDDEMMTAERASLQNLFLKRDIVPAQEHAFRCENKASCQAAAKLTLITGTWAYIGTGYGQAHVGGRPVKILFVAMDTGGRGEPETFITTQSGFRCGAEKPTNAHMGSVHLLLHELVDDKDPVLFSRQFALTNAVKCRRKTGKMETACPGRMKRNCASHLAGCGKKQIPL
jgi:hypothetical protein